MVIHSDVQNNIFYYFYIKYWNLALYFRRGGEILFNFISEFVPWIYITLPPSLRPSYALYPVARPSIQDRWYFKKENVAHYLINEQNSHTKKIKQRNYYWIDENIIWIARYEFRLNLINAKYNAKYTIKGVIEPKVSILWTINKVSILNRRIYIHSSHVFIITMHINISIMFTFHQSHNLFFLWLFFVFSFLCEY